MSGVKEGTCVSAVGSRVKALGADVCIIVFARDSPDTHVAIEVLLFEGVPSNIEGSSCGGHVGLGREVFGSLGIGVEVIDGGLWVAIEVQDALDIVSRCISSI